MAPSQVIQVYYDGKGMIREGLIMLEEGNPDLLYSVPVTHKTPQMVMTRLRCSSPFSPKSHLTGPSTAAFNALSFEVKLAVNGQDLVLKPRLLGYSFDSARAGSKMEWKADGILGVS